MNIHYTWLDVSENLARREQPVAVLRRKLLHGERANGGVFANAQVARVGRFWVPVTPLTGDAPAEWSLTDAGDLVRVPISAYRTQNASEASVFACGLSVGLRAMQQFYEKTGEPARQLHMYLGHQCDPLPGHEAYRCYVGLAIRTDEGADDVR